LAARGYTNDSFTLTMLWLYLQQLEKTLKYLFYSGWSNCIQLFFIFLLLKTFCQLLLQRGKLKTDLQAFACDFFLNLEFLEGLM